MTDEEKGKEFSRRCTAVGVEIRRMYSKRSTTLSLSFCGTDLGSRTECTTRGKVTQTLYILPEISEDVKVRLKGYGK